MLWCNLLTEWGPENNITEATDIYGMNHRLYTEVSRHHNTAHNRLYTHPFSYTAKDTRSRTQNADVQSKKFLSWISGIKERENYTHKIWYDRLANRRRCKSIFFPQHSCKFCSCKSVWGPEARREDGLVDSREYSSMKIDGLIPMVDLIKLSGQ